MSWWQAGVFAIGAISILAAALVAALSAMWRRQEVRDGKR